VLKINVGGRKFQTTLETFQLFPDSNLCQWFTNPENCLPLDDEGNYFLDRDPNYFALILDYLRCPSITPSIDKRLQFELDYYKISIKEEDWKLGEGSQFRNRFIRITENGTVAEKVAMDSYAIVMGNKEFVKGVYKWTVSILELGNEPACYFGILDFNEL